MNENDKYKDNEEKSKSQKIRRILLIKTDEELKKIFKRKSNILINSKTSEEMNKSYDLYNTLLSIKTKVYFNYIKTEELILPMNIGNNNQQINSTKIIPNTKNNEIQENNNNNINNNTNTNKNNIFNDDFSPNLKFFPTKKTLGFKKFNKPKRKENKNFILDGFPEENSNLSQPISNGNQLYKSTKLPKKDLHKLVDKIVNIKMNEDIEKIIKQNIIKLRKYCHTLKNEKVKPKKQSKLNIQRIQNIKKATQKLASLDNTKFVKKSLFGINYKKNENTIKIKRLNSGLKKFKLNLTVKKDIQFNKKNEEEDTNTIYSSKIIRKISMEKIDKLQSQKKRKMIRRMGRRQTINGNFKNQKTESKLIKNKIVFTKKTDKLENVGEYSTKTIYHI